MLMLNILDFFGWVGNGQMGYTPPSKAQGITTPLVRNWQSVALTISLCALLPTQIYKTFLRENMEETRLSLSSAS